MLQQHQLRSLQLQRQNLLRQRLSQQQSHNRAQQLLSQSRRQRLIAMARLLVKVAVHHWVVMRIKWREWAKGPVALVMGKDQAVEPVRD